MDGGLRAAWRHDVFDSDRAGAGSLLFRSGVRERRNLVMEYLTERYRRRLRWAVEHRWITVGVGLAALAGTLFLGFGGVIGAEFLPHLDEGAIWARGTLANSTSLSEGEKFTTNERYVFASFPEVNKVVSEVGRPDDGTDTGGFGNTEYFVDLKPHDQWRPVFHRNKEELIAAMNRAVQKYPGAIWNFSQPIEDNVGETLTGTKGSLALKIFGDDLKTLEQKGEEVTGVMSAHPGHARRQAPARFRPAQSRLDHRPPPGGPFWHQRDATYRTRSRRPWAGTP